MKDRFEKICTIVRKETQKDYPFFSDMITHRIAAAVLCEMTAIVPIEDRVAEWHRMYFGHGANGPEQINKLLEEIGELIEAILLRDRKAFVSEIGDVAWVLIQLNNIYGDKSMTFDDILELTYEKLMLRLRSKGVCNADASTTEKKELPETPEAYKNCRSTGL